MALEWDKAASSTQRREIKKRTLPSAAILPCARHPPRHFIYDNLLVPCISDLSNSINEDIFFSSLSALLGVHCCSPSFNSPLSVGSSPSSSVILLNPMHIHNCPHQSQTQHKLHVFPCATPVPIPTSVNGTTTHQRSGQKPGNQPGSPLPFTYHIPQSKSSHLPVE